MFRDDRGVPSEEKMTLRKLILGTAAALLLVIGPAHGTECFGRFEVSAHADTFKFHPLDGGNAHPDCTERIPPKFIRLIKKSCPITDDLSPVCRVVVKTRDGYWTTIKSINQWDTEGK